MRRRTILRGMAGLALVPLIPRPGFSSSQAAPAYGWDAAVAGPTEADLYVAPDGDDAGPGSRDRPFRSLGVAIARLAERPSGSLALRGGIYRESVSLDALRGSAPGAYRIHRYGSERPVISAADILEGWEPCPADEAEALGIDGPGVYVARLDRERIRHGAMLALNLHEAGTWCSIATLRADMTDPASASDDSRFFDAEPILSGDRLTGLRDRRLSRLSSRQLEGARILVYHAPNLVSPDDIGGFDPASGTLILADGTRKAQRKGEVPVTRYALQNCAPGLGTGTWMVRDRGDQVAVYFRPRDPANLAGGIEVSLRDVCMDLGGARGVDLFGLELVRAAGDQRLAGMALRREGDLTPRRAEIAIRHCRAGETLSTAARGYGAVFLRGLSGLTLENVTVEDARGAFGLFLNACDSVRMRGLHLTRITQSPARFYGLTRSIFAFSLLEDSAREAHANKFNFYEGSDAVLVYGIRTRNCGGYVTYQEASRIHFAFCEFDCAPQSQNRALVSQNRPAGAGQGGADGSGAPFAGGTFWYWNLTLAPDPRVPDPPNALSLGPAGDSQSHAIHNCIIHGGGFADIYRKGADPAKERRSHNLYTGLAFWQTAKNGWRLAAGEQVGQAGRTGVVGRDMRPEIAGIARLFPDFTDWDRDIDGRPVDWSRPPVGCRA